MSTLYLCRGTDERLIHRIKFDGKLFEKVERVHGLGGADAPFDDVEKLAPVNPI